MQVLLCRPTHFDVLQKDKYGNTHMDPLNRPDKNLASEQWDRLVCAYRILGSIVHLIEPVLGLVDMTFVANPVFTFTDRYGKRYAILGNFRPERRRGEKDYFKEYFKNVLGYTTISVSDDIYFEGAGDAIPFDDAILAGYGFRTSRAMIPELRFLTGKTVIPLELQKPADGETILYHLDTAMIVISDFNERVIIAYKGAFTPASWSLLKSEVNRRGGLLFEATYADAANLALNAVVVPLREIALNEKFALQDPLLHEHYKNIEAAMQNKNTGFKGVIITSDAASDNLLLMIKVCGYYPLTLPLSEFLKSGGGAFCLTKILCD